MQLQTYYKVSYKKYFIINLYNRSKRLFTYEYILNKRVKEFQKELSKPDSKLVPLVIILKKIIANEKLSVPRLKTFEKIAPSYL